jgi:hypothetical protein
MAFEWGRIHKWEENYERDITDAVIEYVCEHYEVDSIFDLTAEQVSELETFSNDVLYEYSVMQVGFSNIMMQLDDPEFYNEEEEE